MKLSKIWFLLAALIFPAAMMQAQPSLIAPANNATCVSINAEFSWQPVQNLKEYRIQISDTITFDNVIREIAQIEDESIKVKLPEFRARYFWRVYAVYENNQESVSSSREFSTKDSSVVLSSPDSNTVCSDTLITLEWEPYFDAFNYRIQIAYDEEFTDLLIDNPDFSGTSYEITLKELGTTYYWRVAARVDGCLNEWSNGWPITLKQSPPMVVSPEDGEQGVPLFGEAPFSVSINWTRNDEAQLYHLQVSDDVNFTNLLADEPALADTTYDLDLADDYNKIYYWRVKSIVDGCESYWTKKYTFKTPYTTPGNLIPIDEENCVRLNETVFSWDVVTGADSYQVQIAEDDQFADIIVNEVIDGNSADVTIPEELTQYFWRVRAVDDRNISNWSVIQSFTTTREAPVLEKPVADKAGLFKEVNFVWEDITDDYIYRFQLAYDEDFTNMILDSADIDTNAIMYTMPEANMVYYWRVKAELDGCETDWSDTNMLKTIVEPPMPIRPEDESEMVSTTPLFVWTSVEDAMSYDIEAASDSTFQNIVNFTYSVEDTSLIFSLQPFEEETQYFWRVRSRTDEGKSPWSVFFRFTTGVNIAGAPMLISPEFNETKVPVDVDLIWGNVAGADSFMVEVATDEELTDPVYTATVADTSALVEGLENYAYYYWRVRTKNEGGMGPWSSVFRFRTIWIAPDEQVPLTFPEDEADSTDISMVFTWEPVERAEWYSFQLGQDDSFSDPLFDFNKVYEEEKLIFGLEEVTTYYWRVRAANEAGNAEWSEVYMFRTGAPSSVLDAEEKGFAAFPNPANELMNIDAGSLNIDYILIFDIEGNFAGKIEMNGSSNTKFETSKLAAGKYIMQIHANDGIFSSKFTVAR
jgi:hypothetical protein